MQPPKKHADSMAGVHQVPTPLRQPQLDDTKLFPPGGSDWEADEPGTHMKTQALPKAGWADHLAGKPPSPWPARRYALGQLLRLALPFLVAAVLLGAAWWIGYMQGQDAGYLAATSHTRGDR